jgi:transposase-like protein
MKKVSKKSVNKGVVSNIVSVNEEKIQSHVDQVVRSTVEETLNGLLDAEADRLCNAGRYERSEGRKDTRAGHYNRKLHTKAGEVELKVPKLRTATFETAIIERYRRRESSVEEALIEMYLAGVSVRRVEDITQALWGSRVSSGTVSKLNQKIYGQIESWRNRRIEGNYPYVYLDGICLKRSWGGEVKNVSVLVAIAVNQAGYREVLGVAEGAKEDKEGWSGFLRHLKKRGLKGVQLFISDKCLGLVESLGEFYPSSRWQICVVHFYRNVFSVVPRGRMKEVSALLKAIHAQEDRKAMIEKIRAIARKLKDMKLSKAEEKVKDGALETLSYTHYPREHWRNIRTNNPLERILREVRRRTRVVGCFPDGQSAFLLAAARLRHVAGTKWGTRRYINMDHFKELAEDSAA